MIFIRVNWFPYCSYRYCDAGRKNADIGTTSYAKEDLERTPNSSKNITDFLKVNPTIQFDQERRSSRTQDELHPAEVSINGAQYYQNKFLVNGVK